MEQTSQVVELAELLRSSGFVSLHLRAAPGTENMFGIRELAAMGKALSS
jgi:phosphoglycerate dehydrogenase-like enzyme